MKIRSKIAVTMIISMLLVPLNVVSAATDYNTPTTSIGDTDKTSPCEVTADIHYAYYISLPASLSLEPWDSDKYYDIYTELTNDTETSKADIDLLNAEVSEEGGCVCVSSYQVKARTKSNGLSEKYIRVYPTYDFDLVNEILIFDGNSPLSAEEIQEHTTPLKYHNRYMTVAYLKDEETGEFYDDGDDDFAHRIYQKKIYFGVENTSDTVKVDSTKWATIDGFVIGMLEQGRYRGSFNFVYGLTDSIETYEDVGD